MTHSDRMLCGYKEIATFLGLSTRTVQRYSYCMPISKLKNRVLILQSDLLEWIKHYNEPSNAQVSLRAHFQNFLKMIKEQEMEVSEQGTLKKPA